MAIEKDKRALQADEVLRASEYPELFGKTPRVIPKPAKYRPDSHSRKPKMYPDLSVGLLVVVAVTRGMEREVYLLAQVVDWGDWSDARGVWDSRTDVIVHILEASNTKGDQYVGRLLPVRLHGGGYWWSTFSINSFDVGMFRKVVG